jgi:hypothetical protein
MPSALRSGVSPSPSPTTSYSSPEASSRPTALRACQAWQAPSDSWYILFARKPIRAFDPNVAILPLLLPVVLRSAGHGGAFF